MKKSIIIAALLTMNSSLVFAKEFRDTNTVGERIATRMMEKKESEQKQHSDLKKCLLQNTNAKC
ncbi:hypothetical protein [Pseudobdellovibrio sp. HCB154]|uniref:hypothetical protein n=1 Tax=Pseudobdellovibrio sp. HCB154 TaxID=3386277 RepID=UPI003916F3AE